jgi:hypothetical protein
VFVKQAWEYLRWFCGPLVIVGCVLAYPVYMAWQEYEINNFLVDQALSGNQNAIKILMKYKKPWELDQKVIHSAVKGNRYALEILKIEEKNQSQDSDNIPQ